MLIMNPFYHSILHIDLRKSADDGQPLYGLNPEHKISKIYKEIAEKIKQNF